MTSKPIPLEKIVEWLYRIEEVKLPKPMWVEKKQVFEYKKITLEIVAFLKIVRAVQSLHSLPLLCKKGLFIDYETIIRCIQECCNQVFFLLEDYPNTTPLAKKFVEHFEKTTIDEDLQQKSCAIPSAKIHNSNARFLEKAGFAFEDNKKLFNRSHKALSTSTHALYSSIMQMYGGPHGDIKFQVRGIPDRYMQEIQSEWINVLNTTVSHALFLLAIALKVDDVRKEIHEYTANK